MTVDMMAAVVALARKKNLEPAGRELGLSPSAVHKRIQAANQLFGTRLFTAANDGIQLTAVGAVLYAHAARVIEEILFTEETTIASAEIQARHLLVGHSTYLPPRILALVHHPQLISGSGIKLQHKPGLTLPLVQDVAHGTLHAGLGILPFLHPDLLVYELAQEPVVVCMSSANPLATRAVIRPRDIEREPVIATMREMFPALHQQIEEFFQDFGVELKVVADAFGPPEAVAMAEQRVGLCLLAASNIGAKASVVARPLSPRTLNRRYALFVRQDNRHPALKAFVERVLEKTASGRTSP
ncbi:MAG TPA: LysR family transcriptional regulator [Acidobacteriaceae bacterium]|nr:LysR family transcriptional regulator [Acidobacteriaceae bacterium]